MEVNAGEVLSEDVANTLNERPNLSVHPGNYLSLRRSTPPRRRTSRARRVSEDAVAEGLEAGGL
jgi:hypothetical protein